MLSPLVFSGSDLKLQEKSDFWENVFLDQIQNFNYYSNEIDLLVYKIQEDLATFGGQAETFDIRYHQLRFIMGTAISNPYEYRLIVAELSTVERNFENSFNEFKNLDAQAEASIKSLNDMENDLNSLTDQKFSSTKMTAASVRLIFEIKTLKAQLNLQRKKIADFLKGMKKYIVKFESMGDFLDNSFNKQLRAYFLEPGPSLFSSEQTKLIPYSIRSWISTLPVIIKEKFPDKVEDYIEVLVIFTISLIIYIIFHYLLIKKVNIKSHVPDAYELLLRALAALLIFIGLFATSYVLIFPQTVLFYRLGVAIFGFFAWFFSLGLKMIQSPDTKCDSSISTLFIIFSLGILFQMFGINYILLSLLWPVVLILAVGYQIYIRNKNKTIRRNLYFWTFIILSTFFIVVSLKGYIYLSIFCCMIWFLVSVIFRLGTALTWLIRSLLDNDRFNKKILKVIIIGLGIPLTWFILLLIIYYWASMQISPDSYTVLEYLSGITYQFFNLNIKVIDTIVLIFLFFVFSCTIKAFIKYLSYTSIANKSQRYQVLPSMKSLTRYTGWIIYIIIVMIVFKINITSILVVLGGLSVGIGFGLQHLVNNFLAGLIVMFGKVCRPGDIIELDSKWATVTKTEIRTTTMKTFDNCIITVPNSMLIDKKLFNWTRNNDLIRTSMSIGVAYDSDVEVVKALLLEIAGTFKEVCTSPGPQVLFNEFGDNALIFKLRIWLHQIDSIVAIPSDIRYLIYKRFKENNINIAYPQMDLYLKEMPDKNIQKSMLKGAK